jgi:hypothetical protein
MRCWSMAVVLSLVSAALLCHQGKAKAQFALQLERPSAIRSDVTVWAASIGSAAFAGSQGSWFEAGGRTRHDLPAPPPCLLLAGNREGKRATAVALRPCFCAAPLESLGPKLTRGMSPESDRAGAAVASGHESGIPTASKKHDQGVLKVDLNRPSSLTLAVIGCCCCWFLSFAWRAEASTVTLASPSTMLAICLFHAAKMAPPDFGIR